MGVARYFSEQDYAGRVLGVKQRMEKQGLELLICQDPANMCWLTGFDGWSFYTPQCVIVQLNED